MTVVLSLAKGISKALRNWQVIALLVLVQLVVAFLLSVPLSSVLHQRWDRSLIGAQLASEGVDAGMERTVWDETLYGDRGHLHGLYSDLFMWVSGLVYALVCVLVIAGALPLYSGLDLKFSWDRFWANASRYFRPFFFLAIFAALLFWAADFGTVVVDSLMAEAGAGSDDEPMLFLTNVILTGGLRFLLFGFVVLVFQYAKVVAAAEQVRNIVYLIHKAFVFVGRHFLSAVLLFLVLSILELGVCAVDVAVWSYLLPRFDLAIRLAWLVLITVVLVVLKLSFFACQLNLYVDIRRRSGGLWRVGTETSRYAVEY